MPRGHPPSGLFLSPCPHTASLSLVSPYTTKSRPLLPPVVDLVALMRALCTLSAGWTKDSKRLCGSQLLTDRWRRRRSITDRAERGEPPGSCWCQRLMPGDLLLTPRLLLETRTSCSPLSALSPSSPGYLPADAYLPMDLPGGIFSNCLGLVGPAGPTSLSYF